MLIGFVGDIHGRVFHRMATFIVQVGDLGAYPVPDDKMKAARFVAEDSTELDFSRLWAADGSLAEAIRYIRAFHLPPIHFIRGNHDDVDWLRQLVSQAGRHEDHGTIEVDAFDMSVIFPTVP